MLTLARHELHRLFISPLAWVILALTQLILAYLFLTHIEYFIQIQAKVSAIPGAPGVTELIIMPLLSNTATILMLIAPLITMRLIAEERRNESLPLLLSAPLSTMQIVLGKYIATFIFFVILLALISLMPLSLMFSAQIDMALFASGLLGLLLLTASFTAIGLLFSSLTRQPILAAMATFSSLFLLWIIDWTSHSELASDASGLFNWLSLSSHFNSLLQGIVNTSDLAYYLILIVVCIMTTIRKLDAERLS